MTEDEAYESLAEAFGTTVHSWPAIPRTKPRWWQRSLVKTERRVNAALASVDRGPITDEMRTTFWKQISYGQDYREDAGGYVWRCWCAAIGLPFREPMITYSGYMAPGAEPIFVGLDMGAGDDVTVEQLVPTAGAAPAFPGPQPSALADRRSRKN